MELRPSLAVGLILALLCACPAPAADDEGETGTEETGDTGEDPLAACDPDNLSYAPPPEMIEGTEGLWAVPIDIEAIEAALRFELDSEAHTGSARVQFRSGPERGVPVFDLRQSVTSVSLDGEALDLDSELGWVTIHPDPENRVRVLARELDPCTVHELELEYAIARPDAAGLPSVLVVDGHLNWEMQLDDLDPGARLEAWVPAGFVHDRHALTIEVELVDAAGEHEALSNGEIELLGPGRWRASWADTDSRGPYLRFTSADILERAEGVHVGPDGVEIAYLFHGVDTDTHGMDAVEAEILAELDVWIETYGAYPWPALWAYVGTATDHMEYDGALTINTLELALLGSRLRLVRHELLHMWLARGRRPAWASDGWVDEAWAEYMTANPVELAWDDEPVELLDPHPWARVTKLDAYTVGRGVFQLIAEATSDEALREAMAAFIAAGPRELFTTEELEQHLDCALDDPAVRRAFHRFVYGLEGEPEAARWSC